MIPRSAADGQKVNSRKADEVFGEHGFAFDPRMTVPSHILYTCPKIHLLKRTMTRLAA